MAIHQALALLGIVGALAGVNACAQTKATPEQADFTCAHLYAAQARGHGLIDPIEFTHQQLQKQYGFDPETASKVMRDAVDDQCPRFSRWF